MPRSARQKTTSGRRAKKAANRPRGSNRAAAATPRVEFTRDPRHRSPKWPDGYWPTEEAPPSDTAWDETVRAFERELEVMKRLLRDPRRPLHVKVKHPEAKPHHTLAREAVVLAVHNGYHVAELILLRRMLGAWPA